MKKKLFFRLLISVLIIVFIIMSFYILILLRDEEKPITSIKTKAAGKTYQKLLALNNLSVTRADEKSKAENETNQSSSLIDSPTTISPTITTMPLSSLDERSSSLEKEISEIPTPTSIELVTTPIVTEEESELLAYNKSTISPKASSSAITTGKTKTQTLPETGFYQVSLVLIFISLFVIIFALVV